MARVRPFAAWRYTRPNRDITPLTAPPYDVIDAPMRARLASADPYNVVMLELPEGPLDPAVPGNRYERGQATWDSWRAQGVIAQDQSPCVYVLEQRFEIAGRRVARRAFIVEVGLEPLDAGIILPHERTLPKALGDRFQLTKATGANLSQVFGLFDDPACSTDSIFEAVMASDPVAEATDADGVTSRLWASADPEVASRITEFMADRQIFIADGHHRYTTALAYRDLCRDEAGSAPADSPACDSVMMALVNMDDPDLVVLPYHRIADAEGPFDLAGFESALSRHFELSDAPGTDPEGALAQDGPVSFLFATGDDAPVRVARLRPDVDLDSAIPLEHSAAWKSLDVAVLQELVLWPLLGIHPDKPETLERISFTKDASAALAATKEHDIAFVLRPTRLSQLRGVSLSGETMPQKSTYFYPKLLSGLVFRSAR